MNDNSFLENKYKDLIELIPDYEVPPSLAKELATKFFKASYEVNKVVRDIRNEMIMLDQMSKVEYKNAINRAEGKNVTEKKINAEADTEYLKTLKDFETKNNELEYYRGLLRIMEQGHIFYKGLALD